MRVSYVAHNCVVGLNQQVLVELSRRPDLELSLVAPEFWTQRDYGSRIPLDRDWGGGRYEVVGGRITPDYKGCTHLYYTGLLRHLARWRPQIIEVVAEPYSFVALQVGLGGFTIGFAGRLVAQKGVDTLLRALAALPPDTQALIVGDGPERRPLESLAGELGIADRVRFTGALPRHTDVPRYMSAMDVL